MDKFKLDIVLCKYIIGFLFSSLRVFNSELSKNLDCSCGIYLKYYGFTLRLRMFIEYRIHDLQEFGPW